MHVVRRWVVGAGYWFGRIRRVVCRPFLGRRSCGALAIGVVEMEEDVHGGNLHDVAAEFIKGLFDDFTSDVRPRGGGEDRAFRVIRRGT